MKISAINTAVPALKNTNMRTNKAVTNVINSNYNQGHQNKNKNKSNPSFGFDPVTFALFAGYVAFYAGTVVVANHQIAYQNMESELHRKEVEEEYQNKINDISNKYKVSVDDAKKFHDKYLGCASIPVKGGGNETGLNAVMGYEVEKYKLAMEIIAPIVNKDSNIPNGIILYGPPGGGKTYIADKLGEHLAHFGTDVKQIDFDESDHKGNADKIAQTFKNAEEHFKETGKYTLIRLPDDIDNYFIDRNNENAEYNQEASALIKYGENCAKRGAVWISTANNPRRIDKAVLRPGRTDFKLAIGNMENYAVADMIKYSLYKNGESDIVDKFNYKKVVDFMNEKQYIHTPKEIETIVENAVKHNFSGEHLNEDGLIASIAAFNSEDFPVLDENMIEKFEDDQSYMQETQKRTADNE